MKTTQDEQAAALSEEFHPFEVWVDFRPQDDEQPHWHARRPHWMTEQNIHARGPDEMREKLAAWTPEDPPGPPVIPHEGRNSF